MIRTYSQRKVNALIRNCCTAVLLMSIYLIIARESEREERVGGLVGGSNKTYQGNIIKTYSSVK